MTPRSLRVFGQSFSHAKTIHISIINIGEDLRSEIKPAMRWRKILQLVQEVLL